jgi:hypothetical protein
VVCGIDDPAVWGVPLRLASWLLGLGGGGGGVLGLSARLPMGATAGEPLQYTAELTGRDAILQGNILLGMGRTTAHLMVFPRLIRLGNQLT